MLPIPFAILTCCGFWRPISFNQPFLSYVYYSFSCLMCFLIYTFTLSHLIDVILNAENFESLAGSCFLLLSMINVCCKLANILYYRREIQELLDILGSGHCVPKNSIEQEIQQKHHNKARFVTLCYAGLTETTCMLITARTFFLIPKKIIPFKVWIPYKTDSLISYSMTFLHQTVAHVAAANVQIANETLFCGFLIMVSSQLEILKHRLKQISRCTGNSCVKSIDGLWNKADYTLVKCIEHHRRIIELCRRLNSTFNIVIFFQFAISALVLCSSVYLLSKMQLLSVQFMSLLLYLSCMLYQIFLFCWYGNEVLLQSADLGNAMYHMDWTVLTIKEKKDLVRAMLLVRKPINFTSSFLVTLSIESYCKLLKCSYSVFNLLQRTSV